MLESLFASHYLAYSYIFRNRELQNQDPIFKNEWDICSKITMRLSVQRHLLSPAFLSLGERAGLRFLKPLHLTEYCAALKPYYISWGFGLYGFLPPPSNLCCPYWPSGVLHLLSPILSTTLFWNWLWCWLKPAAARMLIPGNHLYDFLSQG